MADLATLQQTFLDDIYNGTTNSLPYIEDKYHDRLSVYRNNTILTLMDLLVELYPVTGQLIGRDYFRQVARAYAKSHPQDCGNTHGYGAAFPEFLSQQRGMENLAYVADVAAIEWAFFASSIAVDALVFGMQHLQSNDIEDDAFTLHVQPSVHLLELGSNALDIWTAHQGEGTADDIALEHEQNYLLVWRAPDAQVYMQPLERAAYLFLTACQDGQPLSIALDEAAQDQAHIENLQTQFAQFINNGIFTHSIIT